MIDINQVRFSIRRCGAAFGIVIKYMGKEIIPVTGTIQDLKPRYAKIVQDRTLLLPVIQKMVM